ncbi:RNA-binding protein pumilio [Fusarium heterosporum]|uniref:RNA-binding protein pumilio n=1 Tax=Fusarium heterosporum TaxID=42747 RepID=A0A8H5WTE6_FUSHE|nr:RNA-binding protein pumilio [Fusarium heterosporum]
MLILNTETGERSNGSTSLNMANPPWANIATQSPSSSPSRVRNGDANGDSDFSQVTSGIGISQMAISSSAATYNTPYSTAGTPDNFMAQTNGYASYQSHRSNPSRQSQSQSQSHSSPPFRATHAPSNSMQSQRAANTYMSTLKNSNQQAFGLNNSQSIDEPFPSQLGSNVEHQSFQLNPDSRPWINDTSVEFLPQITPQYQPTSRMSFDRVASNRTEQGNSPRTYAASSSDWIRRTSGRDARPFDEGRQMSNQQALQYSGFYTTPYSVYSDQITPYVPGIVSASDAYPQRLSHPLQPAFTLNNYGQGGSNTHRGQDQTQFASKFLRDLLPRLKGSKNIELSQISGHIVECSGHQDVSRFIQNKLQTANSEEKERVFSEIGDNAVPLMKDVYGNYVMQKLMEHGSQAQKARLFEQMKGNIVDLSLNMYGCRVVQRVVELFLVQQIVELLKELESKLESVMVHVNGNHVIQKIVQLVPQQHIGFIIEMCQKNLIKLSRDNHACRVIQRVLEKCNDDDMDKIMESLHPKMESFFQDPWANYVAQHVITNGRDQDRARAIEVVMNNLVPFSKQKLASNAVEKSIIHGGPELRRQILRVFLTPSADGTDTLFDVASDVFGNFVINRLVDALDLEAKQQLLNELRPRFERMQGSANISIKVITSLRKLFEKNDEHLTGMNGLQVEVDSTTPTPVLTNETNSPQSDGPPSANVSAIGVPSADGKNPAAPLQLREHEA